MTQSHTSFFRELLTTPTELSSTFLYLNIPGNKNIFHLADFEQT